MANTASPLTGNHTAKGLKQFLKKANVNYFRLHSSIVTDDKRFPPLNFDFLTGTRVKVWNKKPNGITWEFDANTWPKLLSKLLEKRVLNQSDLKRLF